MKSNPVIVRPSVRARPRASQRGVALFIVLVVVMLSMLLALWASRTSLFSEMVVGNDVDYQRAFEAAQALVQDAELDILSQQADGTDCVSGGSGDVCRQATTAKIPLETQDIAPLIIQLDNAGATKCLAALCTRRMGRQDFWNNDGTITPAADSSLGEATLANMEIVGARYGQYTGASTGSTGAPINPILAITGNATDQGGWYWIEVLPYNDSSVNSGVTIGNANAAESLALYLVPNTVYRITAVAFGRKPNTRVVLQSTYVQKKVMD